MLLYRSLQQFMQKDGKSNALWYMGKYFTYDELFAGITDAAEKLSSVVRPGDVVTICMPNTPECVYCFYAVNRIGAIAHMVHPLAPFNQLKRSMAAAHSAALITLSVNLEKYAELAAEYPIISVHPARSLGALKRRLFDIKVKPYKGDFGGITDFDAMRKGIVPPEPERDDTTTGVYLHSGGTGGDPKIVEVPDRAIDSLAARGLEALQAEDAHGMAMLAALPMFHGFGLAMCVHIILIHGGVSVLMPKFDPRTAVRLIKKNRLHFLVGVPNLFKALLKQRGFKGKKIGNMYVGFVGGDCAPQELLDEFNGRLERIGSEARLFEGYGLTETVAVCAVNRYGRNRRGSLGCTLSGLDALILEPNGDKVLADGQKGEIVVAGDTLMNGYLDNPEANASTFVTVGGKRYVRTGDCGYKDADGYLYFVQRLKRIIKIAGISVYPKEIELSATELDGVSAACAVEYKRKGKTAIALFLVGKRHAECDVKRKIENDLSRYAVPTVVEYLDELPLTAYTKVDTIKLERLAQSIENGRDREV